MNDWYCWAQILLAMEVLLRETLFHCHSTVVQSGRSRTYLLNSQRVVRWYIHFISSSRVQWVRLPTSLKRTGSYTLKRSNKIMIEVFKTDVRCPALAVRVLDRIHRQFDQCQANFDLDDCDRVLRIRMPGVITACEVI